MSTKSNVLVDTFTPIFDAVVQDVGLTGASIYGRIWRYCQGDRQCCTAAIDTIAASLNVSSRTVIRWAKELCRAGYLQDLTPDLRNAPHTYIVTDKIKLVVDIRAMTESHTDAPLGMTESHTALTESQTALTESHSRSDRKSLEETPKRQETKRQEKRQDPAADAADNPAQERLDQLRARLGDNPLDVAANSAKAQADAGGRIWTVPVEAGGSDHAGALMLAEWFKAKGVDPDVVPEQASFRFRRSLSKLAESLEGITPQQATRAVEIVLSPDNPEFSYYTYSDPAVAKFKRDWTDVALRLLSGQPGYLTAQDSTQLDEPIPVNEPYENPEIEPPTDLDRTWQRCLNELHMQTTADAYARWYANTRLLSLQDGIATLAVRDEYAAEWIESRLAPQVAAILGPMTGLDPGVLTLRCTVAEPPARSPPRPPAERVPAVTVEARF